MGNVLHLLSKARILPLLGQLALLALVFSGCQRELTDVSHHSPSQPLEKTTVDPQDGEFLGLAVDVPITPEKGLVLNLNFPFVINGVRQEDMTGIRSIHKATKSLFYIYGANDKTWFYDQKFENNFSGSIDYLEYSVGAEIGFYFYALPKGNFWQIGTDAIIGRKREPEPSAKKVPGIRFSTAFQKKKEQGYRVIYVDNFRILFTNDKYLHIVEKSESGAIQEGLLEIPEGAATKAIAAGGLGEEFDQFWLTRRNEILFLQKKKEGWAWSKAPFQIYIQNTPYLGPLDTLGMILNFSNPKGPELRTAVIASVQNKLYATEALTPLFLEQDLSAIGETVVRSEITSRCVSCHPDYLQLSTIKANASKILKAIEDETMPPAGSPAPRGLPRGALLRWLREGFNAKIEEPK